MATPTPTHLTVVFLVAISAAVASGSANNYLQKICNVTHYKSLCVHSLTTYSSHPADAGPHVNPCTWARAAVSVALAEAENVQQYIAGATKGYYINIPEANDIGHRREISAVSDCKECSGSAVAQLHDALAELRQLQQRTFGFQMENVETWVSSALTDQDTCIDGLKGLKDPQLEMMRSKVINATYFTSNALALVNNLASSGGRL